jgi:hypothetical protein
VSHCDHQRAAINGAWAGSSVHAVLKIAEPQCSL